MLPWNWFLLPQFEKLPRHRPRLTNFSLTVRGPNMGSCSLLWSTPQIRGRIQQTPESALPPGQVLAGNIQLIEPPPRGHLPTVVEDKMRNNTFINEKLPCAPACPCCIFPMSLQVRVWRDRGTHDPPHRQTLIQCPFMLYPRTAFAFP